MDVRVIHGAHSFQGAAGFLHRMDSRDEARYSNFQAQEEISTTTDVLAPRAFVSSLNRFAGKDFHSRQQVRHVYASVDKQHRANGRPDYTSLADVYERSLQNVLNIQLKLKLDDQPCFTQETLSEPLRRNKAAPPYPRGSLYRDYKLRPEPGNSEEEQRLGNSRYSLQGRTDLRDPRRISSSEGSAFHVPSKRNSKNRNPSESRLSLDRYGVSAESLERPLYSRGAAYPSNRMCLSRDSGFSYGTQGSYLTSSHDYFDRWHARCSRDMPPLFSVRCTPVEQRTSLAQPKEHYSGRVSSPDLWRMNGMKNLRVDRGEEVNIKSEKRETFEGNAFCDAESRTSRVANLTGANTQDKKNIRERAKSPPSPRYKPYGLKNKNNSSPVNFKMSTRYRSALKRGEGKKERRSSGQEGEKEEFLSKLGLERVEQ